MEYILWLDADDVMDEENRQKFLALKETLDPSIDMVMMRYHVAFAANGTPTLTFYRERLMRRSASFRWQGRVHEAIVPAGHVIRCDIAVRHQKKGPGNPGRNLRIYERMLAEGETLEPRHRYYYGRELLSAGRLEEAQEQLTACIEDERTWVENRIGACRDLAGCLVRREKAQEALARPGQKPGNGCAARGNLLRHRQDIFQPQGVPDGGVLVSGGDAVSAQRGKRGICLARMPGVPALPAAMRML